MYKMPFLRAASSAAVGGAMPSLRATSSAAERLLGDPSTSLHASASVLSGRSLPELIGGPYRSSGRRYAALARHVERSGAVTGRPVYVPTCHRFRLDRLLTARINWRSMSIPNAAPARRVERSSGRRYAFLARHVERSGAMPFLRAASSAAVGGAMPPLRATSSAAERLLGDATASVLSAAHRPNQLEAI
ncbi:hypothetical protein B0H14DRAFT_2642739 [Mycena olivaceomarginata]|nr:hypothetical protein B0H14DRAFT_2642739 [Mycena olivaceomarginata]